MTTADDAVALVERSLSDPGWPFHEDNILFLADLKESNPRAFINIRAELKKNKDIPVGLLDKAITKGLNGHDVGGDLVSVPELWPYEVDGSELLDDLSALFFKHVILPDAAADTLALWTLGTYCFDSFRVFPKLAISSPEKRCGKTTLLEVLQATTCKALTASNITAAALFRTIDAWQPTLLIDEADTFIRNSDELRGIINSGHTKTSAFVVRLVGDDHEPKKFSTWSPMVIALIGSLPDTIHDRSVIIPMRRRMPGETVEKVPVSLAEKTKDLREQCQRWAVDNAINLRMGTPKLPEWPNDRALDNWAPLFAIAELVGPAWRAITEKAFFALNELDDDEGVGPMLLKDIQQAFGNKGRMFSADLVSSLVDMEERPWCEWKHGKPLTKNSLARLLKPFKIKSKYIRMGAMHQRGYQRQDFADAFERYLPAETPTNEV